MQIRLKQRTPGNLKQYVQLALGFLGCVFLLTVACYGQSPAATPDPQAIVRDASFNEMRASNQGTPFRYRQHTVDDGKLTVKEIFETRDGDMSRLLESDGKPLSGQAAEKERARLEKLRDNPDEQAKKHKHDQADSDRSNEMVKLLPDAFLYTLAGMAPGPNGPCYRLKFQPNPNFQPPDRQAEVYHGMAGELWIDEGQKRLVRLNAHLISDVNFGWGVVGKLFQGGTILVEQKDVGSHHWENTHLELHLSGKILMVKSLHIESVEDDSEFHPVPDAGYQAAIATLLSTPVTEQK